MTGVSLILIGLVISGISIAAAMRPARDIDPYYV